MSGIYYISDDIKLLIQLSGVDYPRETPEFRIPNHEYEDLGGEHGTDLSGRFSRIEPIVFNEKIVVQGYLTTLPYLDFLPCSPGILLMNQRVLDVLLSLGTFEYERFPTRIVDYQDHELPIYLRELADDQKASHFQHNDDYFILHLTSYTPLPQGYDTDPATLPPLFHVDYWENLGGLYVTQQARDALIAAQIHGMDFRAPYRRPEPLRN